MRRLVALAMLVALPACTVGVRRGAEPTPTAHAKTPDEAVRHCAGTRQAADPKRPVIRLTFAVDDAHATVTGTEHVTFTPDLPVTDVVFRLWLNGPESNGGHVDVTRASLPMRTEPAGGTATRPTLLRLLLPKPVAAGTRVTVDLSYVIALPPAGIDRWGHTDRTAWWASGQPLLAWVRGHGWATDDAVALLGETATSEAADYDVTVLAPAGDTVFGNAATDRETPGADGRSRWHFRNVVARDVAVAAGPFTTKPTVVAGDPVVVAVSDELATGADAQAVIDEVQAPMVDAMGTYQNLFGPYAFDSLTVVAIKDIGRAGIEYPGMVFVGSSRYEVVVPHELAHQWFYAAVGNDQARDPWLDEAFATYAEAQVDGTDYSEAYASPGDVGRPMSYWAAHPKDYARVVYGKGAGALLAARAANPGLFDALLRCYVAKTWLGVATPRDLEDALAPMPQAVRILRDAGAFSG